MTAHHGKFISYLRVSTQRQGRSGLGLEAQREAVTGFLNGGRWTLIEEVVEVESGRNNERPQLARALALCRLHRAKLVVAKLDRLGRNIAFVSALMESGVKFIAVDCPEANELTVHILASMAEYEAKAISARTTAALAAAKARGTKLGGLRWDVTKVAAQGQAASLQARQDSAARFRADIMPVIEDKRRKGAETLQQLADALNTDNVPTARGGVWSATQVMRILKTA